MKRSRSACLFAQLLRRVLPAMLWLVAAAQLSLIPPALAQLGPPTPAGPAPTLAPEPAPVAPPPPRIARAEPLEEMIVTAPRRETPTFQEEWEFHKAELERLREIYEPDPPSRFSAGEKKLRMPEVLTQTQLGQPTLLERVD